MSILEQAAFIAELRNARGLNVAEIAAELSRSKSWVTMRLGLLSEMSEPVRQQLFAGAFPVYCYMYLMRQFMRTLPDELLDAARMDGCSEFGVFFRVVLPLVRPALVVVFLNQFLNAWKENHAAIKLYQSLGFEWRSDVDVAVLERG